ncbi:MAG: hypothetical protein ACHQPH_22915 [Reyranellales bacterium]|jgi:uncharacterized membrane protein
MSALPRRTTTWLVVAGLLLLVLAANAHLVFVAVTSQPECVDKAGAFHAAASTCPSGARP